ncbi:glycosyltransferase [[Clostridium] aminophilum]|uniref:glycosyltransferase n=1 Tax=[Clostridium] aminophilum TaxID=1526 RepID=UPI003F9DCA38
MKYNSTRDKAYQIKTEIYETPERKVVKTALCPEGREHITSFAEKYRLLSEQSAELRYAEPEIIRDGMSVRFPYIEGELLSEIIANRIGETLGAAKGSGTDAQDDLTAVFDIIRAYAADIFRVAPDKTGPFRLTDAFLDVFGASGELFDPFIAAGADGKENSRRTREELEALLADESWTASNIDALFANMIRTKDGMFALDYEWVFLFPVPAGFVKYRILSYCMQMLQGFLGGMTEEEFLGHFPEFVRTEPELLDLYRKMERGFQAHVHSKNQYDLQEKYIVQPRTIRDLAQVHHERDELRERVEQLKAELSAKDTELKKVREVQRLTNNHVTNLTAIIEALRHENGEMAKTLAYLNRHEALIFKGKRKLGKAFNHLYPQGSTGRKCLGYIKRGILNPAEGIRLLTTEEGKNLVKGDFEIGAEYRTYGKIRLPYYENPMVSIVIPVYNQIHYTYLCLQSILEHTTDVTYEVIIADDVSKDATEHLTEFVENVVICRNATNQGFLRNCNNAAKSARGKYVMFLNNDTQVTEGWLSSLVNLIESDDSIGMVGSKLVYPDGRLQEAGGIIWSDGSGWNYGRLDDSDKPEYNYVKDVDYISGAAILLSTELWKEIGGFDDRFAPAYCEDSDLAFEVRRHGKRVVYQPLSKVIHFEGVSNGTDVNGTGLKRYQVENSRKLKEKWKDVFARQCENTGNPDPFRARERSMGKPMILVVDHYVPTYDRDAGSKTTFQYLKMFIQEGFQVKFLGDNFLHEEPYTTALQQMGIEVLYGAEYETGIWDWLEKHQNDIAVAYLNRPHIATKYVDFIAEHTNISMIFYGHDLHFMRLYREYELSGDVKKRTESEYWKSVEFTLMHKVAISYYPSQVEIDAIHAQDPEIPARAITAYVYDEFKEKLNLDFEKREGLLFVGGFAHPPNADAVLWFMDHVWPRIHEALPEVKFHIVGSKATDEIKALHDPENGVIVEGFVSEERLGELYETTRIDVVPLRYGAGVKGKVVEALYNGMPIVTTSVGAEGIPEVETVLRVEDEPAAFADAVVKLYRDPETLARMAQGTQDYVKKNFSTEAAWSVIEEDFRAAGVKSTAKSAGGRSQ